MSCILGTKCMGHVLLRRPCLDLWYIIPVRPRIRANCNSRSASRSYCQSRCDQQRHQRTRRRHLIRSSTRNNCENDIYPDTSFSNHSVDQALLRSHLGYIHWRCYSMWICLISLWLACPWEGYPTRHYTIQPYCSQGPSISWSLPTARRGRPRLTLSASLYSSWISHQNCIYDILAGLVLVSIWPLSAGVGRKKDFPVWSTESLVYRRFDTINRILLSLPRIVLRSTVRILAAYVHELIFGAWGCGELGWISGCVFYILGGTRVPCPCNVTASLVNKLETIRFMRTTRSCVMLMASVGISEIRETWHTSHYMRQGMRDIWLKLDAE